jgi:hypothetical protein
MDDQMRDYAVGYGKPPVETRFQKGQSGNPEGRPRGRRSLVALLGDALSHRSGMRNPDGSYKTQAEAIFAGLVGVAAGPDLKAKKLLFDVLIRLQQANICWPQERLPEVQFDESQAVTQDEVSARLTGSRPPWDATPLRRPYRQALGRPKLNNS